MVVPYSVFYTLTLHYQVLGISGLGSTRGSEVGGAELAKIDLAD